MAYRYRTVKRRFIKDGTQQEKYFASSQSSRLIELEELAKEISIRSAVKESSVVSVLMELSDSIGEKLTTGYSLKLKGIGVFSVALTSDGFDTEKEVEPRKVRFSKLCFRPDKKIIAKLKDMKFERTPRPPKGIVVKQRPNPRPPKGTTPPDIQNLNTKE
ncbi:MAG: hypothetical protein PHV83_02620 [Bacteroidales bacterium]|jgi:predicted histone-like DNA-binding protein|nr:hypothetical protein [Bacteroidales bacterium]MDD4544918.1 hypothetical protein [Bacteroidales bacterium]